MLKVTISAQPEIGVCINEIPAGHLAKVVRDDMGRYGTHHQGIALRLAKSYTHPEYGHTVWVRGSNGEANQAPMACNPAPEMRFVDLGEANITVEV
jgi:hypothetical protein